MTDILVVVLHLLVWDADTGTLLDKQDRLFFKSRFDVTRDLIEECRISGVKQAKSIALDWRKTHPNAFANVDCEWERSGEPT